LATVIKILNTVATMPDATPEEAARKKETYLHVVSGEAWRKLKALADIKLAPFFLSKRQDTPIATEQAYRAFLNGQEDLEGHPIAGAAERASERRHFFHWFLEFAEVMQGGGFDCFLGNPPFLGNRKLKGTFGTDYLDYLTYAYSPAGAIDLVGYFVRRNYDLLYQDRALGTLSTNSLAQGGTREGSLEVIEKQGGSIVMAVRSRPWPGEANVDVSLAAIYKGQWKGSYSLDGKEVHYISTYFDEQLSIGNPFTLAANGDTCYQGTIVLGMGFVIDQALATALVENCPRNSDVISQYLDGDDIKKRSDQSPSRWVIDFHDWPIDRNNAPQDYSGPVAADYPDCLDILERLVKPERTRVDDQGKHVLRKPLPERWWQYADKRPALYRNIKPLQRVIAAARVSEDIYFSLLRSDVVFHEKVVVITADSFRLLSILTSSFHYSWSWKYVTTMRSAGISYSVERNFETFPFPPGFEPNSPLASFVPLRETLDSLGSSLDAARRKIMLRLDIGLTKLYNLYHTPNMDTAAVIKESKCSEADADWAMLTIIALRDIHKAIDEAVRDAYGWNDLPLQHGFHELEFLPEGDRVRYTISNDARRIVLRKLLALNHKRHAEEVAAGIVDESGKIIKKKDKSASEPKPKKRGPRKTESSQESDLFS
ncbi:MAG TPA: restriction endonuclease, partial [Bacillota bacterium]|nr:restriction endonuclease [Bacillota bacterium]